jgi:hypothetical protein
VFQYYLHGVAFQYYLHGAAFQFRYINEHLIA